MSDKDDIKGTRYDNTMNIEGEGSEDMNRSSQVSTNEAMTRTNPHKAMKDPCQVFGHRPSGEVNDDGSMTCRFCGAEFWGD